MRPHRGPGPRLAGAVVTASLALAPPSTAAQEPPDSAAAMAAFRGNIDAIHRRDRAAYLNAYLRSDRLVRAGPAGLQHGYESLAASAGAAWPDTLVATHFRLTPLADGVAYGAYRYRVVQGGTSQRGVSERVLVRTPEGWKVAVTTAFPAPSQLPPPPFAFVGATLVDGTGSPPVPDAAVVTRDGRIECAGPRDACPVPSDAEVIDATGRWLVPGLVDAHVHYSQTGWADGRPDAWDARERFPYEATVAGLREHPGRFHRAHLCSGVTAAFDVGGFPWTWELREAAEDDTGAPHVAAAGPLLSTRDHWLNVPGERQFIYLSSEEEARAAARYLVANRTDAVKVWYLVGAEDPDTAAWKARLRAAALVAREAGVPLIVHATGLWQAKDALRAGARLLVHSVYDGPVDDEFLGLAREAGAIYTPTLTVFRGYQQLRLRRFEEQGLPLSCVDAATLDRARLTDSLPEPPEAGEAERIRRSGEERLRLMEENLRRVHGAGIPVAMGTDAGNPLTLHGVSVYAELEAMQQAGLTAMEVLVAATRNGARAMFRGDDLGTVETGKVANLLLLDEDPTRDVSAFRALALVVRRGEPFTRRELEFPPR